MCPSPSPLALCAPAPLSAPREPERNRLRCSLSQLSQSIRGHCGPTVDTPRARAVSGAHTTLMTGSASGMLKRNGRPRAPLETSHSPPAPKDFLACVPRGCHSRRAPAGKPVRAPRVSGTDVLLNPSLFPCAPLTSPTRPLPCWLPRSPLVALIAVFLDV